MERVSRFLLHWVRPSWSGVRSSEITLSSPAGDLPATLLCPPGKGPYPAWIILHGITVPGRLHPSLIRFSSAVAAAGAMVLIPEVREWTELQLDQAAGSNAIMAGVNFYHQRTDITGPITLAGFSFGATQALISAARPEFRKDIRRVIGFGGYCDFGRTLRSMMTGEHEWEGVHYQYSPDPYGRWIAAANYIRKIPEYAEMEGLARAAHTMAAEAGQRGINAADPAYDTLKGKLAEGLSPAERELWKLIAPPAGVLPEPEQTRELADRIVAAAVRQTPDLDPKSALPQLDQRVILVHGRDDHLIPFTETLRLAAALPPAVDASVTITRLFAHSREADRPGLRAWPGEVWNYLSLLRRALAPTLPAIQPPHPASTDAAD
ncbi:MAG: hypothetical protein LBG44_06255 [Gemmatimonadota bacterium]|jgi:dienelactone hydrolase|nr:hypothetical protein [Gemmatimonadota bacterium]